MGQTVSKSLRINDDIVPVKKSIGIVGIILYHRLILRIISRYKLQVPPVLLSILGVLGGLYTVKELGGKSSSENIIKFLDPAADFLGFWMPLWLAPPLVVLPNALSTVKGADRAIWIKLAVVHVICWLLTVLGASQLYRALKTSSSEKDGKESDVPVTPSPGVNNVDHTKFKKKLNLLRFWGAVAAGFYALAAKKTCDPLPALATTSVAAFCGGDMLPPSVKKAVHPVIFTAVITGIASVILHKIRNEPGDWLDALRGYFANGKVPNVTYSAGDLFFSMLGPCCIALTLRIYCLLQLPEMQEVLPAVLTTGLGGTLASLLASPVIGRAAGLPPELCTVLSHRSITTSLAVPSAQAMGVSPELTVAAVLISGLYGTSPELILKAVGMSSDRIGSGVTMGMASHSLGTASLMSLSGTSAAAASLTMFSAGIFHAFACSVPQIRTLALTLAGRMS